MKTLVKALLFVLWLLGAGAGISLQGTEPARDAAAYYTVAEGFALSTHGNRVTLHLESRALPGGGVSLSAAVPRWAAVWPARPDPALRAASASADESTRSSPAFAHAEP